MAQVTRKEFPGPGPAALPGATGAALSSLQYFPASPSRRPRAAASGALGRGDEEGRAARHVTHPSRAPPASLAPPPALRPRRAPGADWLRADNARGSAPRPAPPAGFTPAATRRRLRAARAAPARPLEERSGR